MNKSGKVKSGKVAYKLSKKDKKILQELLSRPEGLRAETILKLINLPQRTLYRRLNKLKSLGFVENIFPIWKIVNGQSDFCQSLLGKDNIFELHNMSWIVKLIKVPEWWFKRKNYLIRLKDWEFKKIDFGKANSNPYIQLKNENFVVQCYPESLIIISRKRYYSNNPYETSIEAMNDVLDLLDWFCERFRFNFFAGKQPHLEVRNNDFNRLNDALANHIRGKNEKGFLIRLDKRRKVWIDYSEPFGKEANYPGGQEILEKVTRDFLINKPMTNSELQLSIQQVTQNQLMFNENFESHVEAIKTLSETVKELRKEIKRLNKK